VRAAAHHVNEEGRTYTRECEDGDVGREFRIAFAYQISEEVDNISNRDHVPVQQLGDEDALKDVISDDNNDAKE
jgi:hypothetical protein